MSPERRAQITTSLLKETLKKEMFLPSNGESSSHNCKELLERLEISDMEFWEVVSPLIREIIGYRGR